MMHEQGKSDRPIVPRTPANQPEPQTSGNRSYWEIGEQWARVEYADNAGVLEEGVLTAPEEGTPQGGSISPLLANIYLHYALDLWAEQWRRTQARGDVIIVRYADDFVVGFQHESDARRFHEEMRERFRRFNLELAEEKTRVIEFGRYAAERRSRRGQTKPPTFNFPGFTHICGKTKKGMFRLLRQTIPKRMRNKLQQVKLELKRRIHEGTTQVGRCLAAVVGGHYRYYGVPGNEPALRAFGYPDATMGPGNWQ